MTKLISYFIKKPKVVNLILAFIFLAGSITVLNTTNQGYPTVDFGTVSITTILPGASPKDVEIKVTDKLEDELEGISGIKDMMSYSVDSVSQIIITLDDGADFEKTKQDISKAIDQVDDLPAEIKNKPTVFELNNDAIPVMEIAITGTANMTIMRQYAKSLEDQLSVSPLVGKINKLGYLKREVQVQVDQEKLSEQYISIAQAVSAIQSHNFRLSAGTVKAPQNEEQLSIDSEFQNPLLVKEVIIRSGFDGNRIQISDIAKIQDGFEDPTNIIRSNGIRSINLDIQKKPDADVVHATNAIKAILKDFQKQLPENLNAVIVVDYSVEVKGLLELVINNAKLGFILVMAVLILFLNPKVAFWTAVGIPSSIFIGFMLFPTADVTINFISLIAFVIVLGMLVDDAILVAENIYFHREQGMSGEEAAIKGVQEVMWPVITTVLTTIIAFLPMMFMSGVMGKFMQMMPLVITFTLIGSLLECLFILPAHMAHTSLSENKRPGRIRQLFKNLEQRYHRFVQKAIRHRVKTLLSFIGIFFLAIILMFTVLEFRLFPSDDGIMAYLEFETPKGSELSYTSEKAKEIEAILQTVPKTELKSMVTTIGQRSPRQANNFISLESSEGHLGNTVLHFTYMNDRERSSREIISELQTKLDQLDGFEKLELKVVNDGPPVGNPITVRFVSNNDTARNTMADELTDFLHAQAGVFAIDSNETEGKNELDLALNTDSISRLGLQPIQVANTIKTAFEGQVATQIRRNGEEVDFRVILEESDRRSLDTIQTLTVENNAKKLIPIGQLLQVNAGKPTKTINHFDGDRAITIVADIDPKIANASKINRKIKTLFEPKVAEYPDMRMIFGGEEQETQESMKSLATALILALSGIYFVLVILFNSFSQPFLIMLTIPYSFSGVIFSFTLQGYALSFPAMIGMIGLIGVVVNNALVMISFLNYQVEHYLTDTPVLNENTSIPPQILADGAKRRFRPIVLTTLTTAAGLLPSAYGFGGDNPIIIPMITAIAWGLIFSTVISLILIPAVYAIQLDFNNWLQKSGEKIKCFCLEKLQKS